MRKAARHRYINLPVAEVKGVGERGGEEYLNIKDEGEYGFDLCRIEKQGLTPDICKDVVTLLINTSIEAHTPREGLSAVFGFLFSLCPACFASGLYLSSVSSTHIHPLGSDNKIASFVFFILKFTHHFTDKHVWI